MRIECLWHFCGILAAIAILVGGPAPARAAEPAESVTASLTLSEGLALAQKNQCMGCHQIDSRRVGPPFRAVARRFAGQPQAAQYLAGVVRGGSSGQWGAIPMPAQTRVSPQDALQLARWILALDKR